jgi:lipoprotein-releasing system permease protein
MKLSLYIAKRYLFAKKSRNAINVISSISVAGVTVGTMALIIVLSVFNGLESLVRSIFNTFDPDLKITPLEGKTFIPDSTTLSLLSNINGVACYSLCVEENALLRYGEKQYVATIKGVDDNYAQVTGIDSSMWDGGFVLRSEQGRPYAIPGIGIANYLGMRVNFITPLNIYVPKRTGGTDLNPEDAFIRNYIFPSGIYQVEQEYDSKYVFIPIDFARELLEYKSEVSSLEIKFETDAKESAVQKDVVRLFGKGFIIQNKYEQQEIFYKVMKSERIAIFFILTLILIIASFSIIGSLTMLIIEKERDIGILRSLGADNTLIRKIFIFEGWLISIIGAFAGILLGFAVCWLQSDSLIVNAYPVVMKIKDFIIVPVTVLVIGFWAAWYPVRYLTKKYLTRN